MKASIFMKVTSCQVKFLIKYFGTPTFVKFTFLKVWKKRWLPIMESTHENTDQSANELASRLSVDDVDVDFLPIIYDIIRGLEKDPHEASLKPAHSQDISQKVLDLHKKLELAKEQIKRLPGVEYSKEQQLDKLEALRTQFRLKKDLLRKYRTMCTFDIPKPQI